MSDWRIPLSDLDYGDEESEAVLRILKNKWLSMGAEVKAFEDDFAAFLDVKHAVAVTNGTAALHLALLATEVGRGDEVIQPAINFVAAANMTVAVGATPIFADIVGLNEPMIDATEIENKITVRTKAIIVMHYGGYICSMNKVHNICKERGLILIEDACHAIGARCLDPKNQWLNFKMAGTAGDIGCFSFFSNKNVAIGEGGMVVTNQDALAANLRLLRSHGMTSMTWDRHQGHASSYDVVSHGYNYRLDEMRAALGRVQLRKLRHNNLLRKQAVLLYHEHLKDMPGWIIPFDSYVGDSAYHLMIIIAPDADRRKRVIGALRDFGIQTSLHYPCINNFNAFAEKNSQVNLKHSLFFSKHAITLPLFSRMSRDQVKEICTVIRSNAM